MLSIFLPTDCLGCGNPPVQFCESCKANLLIQPRPVIRRLLPPGFAHVNYDGVPKTLVHEFKQLGSWTLAKFMAGVMSHSVVHWLKRNPGHPSQTLVLIPAPSRREATRRRGYQPAEMLAKELARLLRGRGFATVVENCLAVASGLKDQSLLTAEDRERNLEGKVRLLPGSELRLQNCRIVLVDDVVTTGATLRAMSFALRAVQLEPEIFLTFAETL